MKHWTMPVIALLFSGVGLAQELAARPAPRTGEDQYARVASLEASQRLPNLAVHRRVEAVQSIRPIQRQSGNTATDIKQNRLVAHGYFSS